MNEHGDPSQSEGHWFMTRNSVNTSPFWVIFIYLSSALWGQALSAQGCFVGYTSRDTVVFQIDLGICEITASDILSKIGLSSCTDASLTVNSVGLNSSRNVDLINDANDQIVDNFVVKVSAKPELSNSTLIYEISPFDCVANKTRLLDELNVPDSSAIRANIHFISGTSRLTNFPIGDTIQVDRVVCGDGYTYATNVKVLFEPEIAALKNSLYTYNIGFTTRLITIDEILNKMRMENFFHYTCDISRYRIENAGPFGYGLGNIGDIYLDEALIAENLSVNIISGACPLRLLGMPLDTGQCYINKADILDTLGFNSTVDDYSKIILKLKNGDSLEDESFIIESISVNGYVICNQSIPVSYTRLTAIGNESTLACNGELNISLDASCEVHLNSDVLLQSGNYCYLNYIVKAQNADGIIVAEDHNIILREAGVYRVSITNPRNSVSCWSTVNIEDKHIYNVTCPPDTVLCFLNLNPTTNISGPAFPYPGVPSTYMATTIPRTYNVVNSDICGIKKAEYTDQIVQECTGSFKEVIDRLWTFHDSAGNKDTCHQYVYVTKPSIDSVDLFVPFMANCLSDFTVFDDNGNPSPEETGYPTINGGLYNAGVCGTLKMTYSDNHFGLCGKSIKIIREWVILDWCNDRIDHRNQTILIEDELAPIITNKLEDLYLNSHPFLCGADNIVLPQPQYTDCGSDDVTVEVLYEYFTPSRVRSIISNGSSYVIASWRMTEIESSFQVYYHLTDACGNVGKDTITVHVVDNQPPVAVCDQITSISIAGNGEAQVKALTFDDLSVDNCGIAKYEARKMEGDCYVDNEFKELLLFCCEEVGKTIRVEFKVTDIAGNYNTCMVFVEVFDKFTPIIACPANITIDCVQDYKNTQVTGQAQAIDNCSVDSLYFTDQVQLDDCGKGIVRRQWIAKDRSGQKAMCEQVITVVSTNPFVMTTDKYPRDTTINGCLETITPEFTGIPNLSDSTCSQILTTYEDTYFTEVSGACFKIIRDWIVIDWCQYSTNQPTTGRWMKAQAIKVINSEAPTFINTPKDTILCAYGSSCTDIISVRAFAIDDCTAASDLDWYSELYYDPNNPQAVRTGTSAQVQAQLAPGSYQLRFTVSDGCGNFNNQMMTLVVQDCAAPTINCPTVVASAVLNTEGQVDFDLSDLSFSASDNCSSQNELTYSFAEEGELSTLSFSCIDLINGISKDTLLNLYVSDSQGNMAHCEFVLKLSDNSTNVCEDILPPPPMSGDTLMAAGLIMTEENTTVDEVRVQLKGPNGQKKTWITSSNGMYSFDDLSFNGDYEISFSRGGDIADGLTTLDLLFVQRHLIGLGLFDSPLKVVAADVDNNGKISGSDLAKMRRIILGTDLGFDNDQQIWRFVRVNHQFDNPFAPFPFPETISLQDISDDYTNLNMTAIKIGDVNGSNKVSSRLKSKGRSIGKYQFVIDLDDTEYDKTVRRYPVYAQEARELFGFQFGLMLDDISMDNIYIESGQIDILPDHYNVTDNVLRVSWNTQSNRVLTTDVTAPLFYILVKKGEGQVVVSDFSLVKDIQALAISSDLTELDLDIMTRTSQSIDQKIEMSLSANSPNPFVSKTEMKLTLIGEQTIILSVYSLDGQLLYTESNKYTTGVHDIILDTNYLHNFKGVMMVQVTNGQSRLTRKIVSID